MKRAPLFASEAELCAAFIAWAKGEQLIAYAETEGWDILLVAPKGEQIGVQAKMAWNMKVLSQTLPSRWEQQYGRARAPDYRAILLPQDHCDADDVCHALGIIVFTPKTKWGMRSAKDEVVGFQFTEPWHFWNPEKRHDLPAYIPDVAAGASGPIQLTKWKIAALEICAVLEIRGYVTRSDFSRAGVDSRRWVNYTDWLTAGSSPGRYVRGPGLAFDRQHPTVYQQVLADVREKYAGSILEPEPELLS